MPPMPALISRTKCLLFDTPDSHATGNNRFPCKRAESGNDSDKAYFKSKISSKTTAIAASHRLCRCCTLTKWI
ncbi:hypothetical protein M791_03675 [Neisseria gonorrhoeae MU_NG26]|uniref:Uncharacterized protein n=1 Tax=Neisseria gonorrhoeae 3502 TaxID=1193404 RepID=A0AA44U6W0_NEIGO|nr:hypothetical protein M684_01630 [Neisseria gonorrhoeae SK15454]KLR87310.1 hypothetical protein M675_06335 [Neisseria gonorrhoeae SK1902]KLS05871.1 hypothetical protein M725_02645 [Neisseria gonorrhoeae ATL_2011_01_08]KLS12387.1 hypothetical protein M726_03360 [Neisseria gonorrhoeae ATL_2011_01_17]KLS12811.1 hypothetical protein M716_06925 [Neisseria gonorrhoeae SK32402]KLS20781.1 hypothetical protein M731_04560 [Neisseria gonorrhoeae ATL_2011_01-25]KLS21375.1 hypothetical protein M719_0930